MRKNAHSRSYVCKSVRIYSRLSLKPMVIGHRGNQISCRAGEEKCSSGRIWYCSECRGVEKLSGETQKCHRVGCQKRRRHGHFKTLKPIFLNRSFNCQERRDIGMSSAGSPDRFDRSAGAARQPTMRQQFSFFLRL